MQTTIKTEILAFWVIRTSVNTMSRGEDMNNDLRGTTVAAQSIWMNV